LTDQLWTNDVMSWSTLQQ